MGEMTGGLPPGPWRTVKDGSGPVPRVVDRDGGVVLEATWDDWHGASLSASPEVLRAIEASPKFVEAASWLRLHSESAAAWRCLMNALDLANGLPGGRPDERDEG